MGGRQLKVEMQMSIPMPTSRGVHQAGVPQLNRSNSWDASKDAADSIYLCMKVGAQVNGESVSKKYLLKKIAYFTR